MAEDWDPEATTGKQHYREFIKQVRAALARLDDESISHKIEALIWCQGELDSTRQHWADQYEANLRNFISTVRTDLGETNLPFIIVLTGDGRLSPRRIASDAVRRAQQLLAEEDANTFLVSGDDLTLKDSVHYDAQAQLILGQRLAEVISNFRNTP